MATYYRVQTCITEFKGNTLNSVPHTVAMNFVECDYVTGLLTFVDFYITMFILSLSGFCLSEVHYRLPYFQPHP